MNEQHHMTNGDIVKGGAGALVTLAAWAFSLSNVETALRLASLAVGLSVGVWTLCGMWHKKRSKRRK